MNGPIFIRLVRCFHDFEARLTGIGNPLVAQRAIGLPYRTNASHVGGGATGRTPFVAERIKKHVCRMCLIVEFYCCCCIRTPDFCQPLRSRLPLQKARLEPSRILLRRGSRRYRTSIGRRFVSFQAICLRRTLTQPRARE